MRLLDKISVKVVSALEFVEVKKNWCILKEITILWVEEASNEQTWSKKMIWKWVKARTRPNFGYFLSASNMFSDYALFNNKDKHWFSTAVLSLAFACK